MTDVILVLVTLPNQDKAAEIGRTLVEEKLAACANIIPEIRSIYDWDGEIYDEGEVLMLLKTRDALFEDLKKRVVELHPYEVPEVLRLGIEAGHAPYLDWVRSTVRH